MYTLHDACESNNIEYIKNNVTKENVNEKNNNGLTAFFLACEYGHKEIAEIILKTDGFNSLNEKDNFSQTPFLLACRFGYKEIAELILKTDGFNGLNEKDKYGRTPFSLACCNGYKEIAEIILKTNGFNSLNEKSNDGSTAFSSTYWYGRKEIIKILLKQSNIIIPEKIKHNEFNANTKDIQSLIELYKKDPLMVRTKLILENNLDVYRHIIFICDGYFTIKNTENPNTRFMKIAVRLPLDLQMVLIHRLSLSTKQNITGKIFGDNIEDYITKYLISDKPQYYYQSNLKSQNLTELVKAKLSENFYKTCCSVLRYIYSYNKDENK
jgi:ankyrin repeat protein